MKAWVRVLLVAMLTALAAVESGIAWADSYCVAPATGCQHSAPTVHAAFTDAAVDTSGSATIQLGAATYDEAALGYSGSEPLTLIGAGPGQTILTGSGGSMRVLQMFGSAPVNIQNLTLRIPGATNGWIGVEATAPVSLTNIGIDAVAGSVNAQGIVEDGTFLTATRLTISLPGSATSATTGVTQNGPGAGGTMTIQDSTIDAALGFLGQSSDTTLIHRSRVSGDGYNTFVAAALSAGPGRLFIDDSLLRGFRGAHGLFLNDQPETPGLRHVTIVGDDSAGQAGIRIVSSSGDGAVVLLDSIIEHFPKSLWTSESGGHTSSLTNSYDDFPGATTAGSGPFITATTFAPGTGNVEGDPRFVSATDFHLLPTSPLLNRDPSAIGPAESATDLDGLPRFGVSGARDFGAYQHQPPSVAAGATPGTAAVGAPIQFTASGTDPDPGDTLSYSGAFDDGSSASGASASHAFATVGRHTATVTVMDATGLSANATAGVTVSPLPPPLPRPVLQGFTLTNRTFVAGGSATPTTGTLARATPRGTTFRFRISTAATIGLRFERAVVGRRTARGCLPARKKKPGRHDRPCTRFLTAGRLTRNVAHAGGYAIAFSGRLRGSGPLPPGRYRAILGAANRAGAASEQTLAFSVVAVKQHRRR